MGGYVGKREIEITSIVRKDALVGAIRELTISNEDFDHRQWSIYDADTFEQIATMIRAGYEGGKKS
jgi:hypothetical protein